MAADVPEYDGQVGGAHIGQVRRLLAQLRCDHGASHFPVGRLIMPHPVPDGHDVLPCPAALWATLVFD
jgi:hypothetical protein